MCVWLTSTSSCRSLGICHFNLHYNLLNEVRFTANLVMIKTLDLVFTRMCSFLQSLFWLRYWLPLSLSSLRGLVSCNFEIVLKRFISSIFRYSLNPVNVLRSAFFIVSERFLLYYNFLFTFIFWYIDFCMICSTILYKPYIMCCVLTIVFSAFYNFQSSPIC